jgi:ABC-type nitrate/sulfonate/bicarbonate transport system ATPase subunit
MILGLDTDYTGRITVGGSAVSAPGVDRGIVFQEPRLVPWKTVRANIEFALPPSVSSEEDRQMAINSVLDVVGLADFESALPAKLSGGMAQRVALARALVSVPRVLLMDEPLAALDLDTRIRMQQEILRIHELERTTTLMVTHDIDEALFLSDRVVILSGRPTKIRADIRVDMEAPRVRSSSQFLKLRGEVLKSILPEIL